MAFARRLFAVVVVLVGVLVALMGILGALVAWGMMRTYPDDAPNTLLQNLSPLLVLLPAVALGAVLGFCGRDLWREPGLIAQRPVAVAVYIFTGLAVAFFVAWIGGVFFW